MLHIEFFNNFTHKYKREEVVRKPNLWWQFNSKPGWLDNDVCKQMVKDIDDSEVISDYVIISPIFGSISPMQLSGGVIMLAIIYNTDNICDFTACGDDCVPWLIKLGTLKDVYVTCNYIPHFPLDGFELYANGTFCKTRLEVLDVFRITHWNFTEYMKQFNEDIDHE